MSPSSPAIGAKTACMWLRPGRSTPISADISGACAAELRSSSACAARDLKSRRSKTEEEGKMSLKRTQNRDFSLLGTKGVDFFAQLSVLASCPASTSSWDRPQTKQRLSKWSGVELRVSLATRRNSNYIKNSSFLPGPQNEPRLFHSTNSFTCHMPSYRKIHRGDRPLFKLRQGLSRPSIDRSISTILVVACRRLPLECWQNRANVRMKVQNLAWTNKKKRFWGQVEAASVCNWWSVRLSHGLLSSNSVV